MQSRELIGSCETADDMTALEGLIRAATTYIRRTCLMPDSRNAACAIRVVPGGVDICWVVEFTITSE
jgi:hypothetical protein